MTRIRLVEAPGQRICAGCRTTRLSRYNPEVLCGACLLAARTPPADSDSTADGLGRARWVWDSGLFRDALARTDMGAALAIFRTAAGLSQLQLAQILGCSQTTVFRLEAGERKSLYDVRELLRFADTIGMPRIALLPLLLGRNNRAAQQDLLDPDPAIDADADLVPLARAEIASSQYLMACVARLSVQGQAAGGGSVRGQAVRLWQRVCHQLDAADYDDLAGKELMRAAGELAVLAGWACFDCDDERAARKHYGDALLRAGLADADQLAVHAMVDQALLLAELTLPGRPGLARQAIWLTRQAAELARRDPSPRLHALIAAREAVAGAAAGDRGVYKAAITRAVRELDREPDGDDPVWAGFVRPAEIAAHEAHGLALLGDGGAGELYRAALRDAGLPARSAAVCRARLAVVLAADGDAGQAVGEAAAVLDLLDGPVSSPRTLSLLRPVRVAAGDAGLTGFCDRYDAIASTARL